MANEGLRDSIAELQDALALARARKKDWNGALRSSQAADTLRQVERWRRDGWFMDGGGALFGKAPQGRGWHDVHKPSKL